MQDRQYPRPGVNISAAGGIALSGSVTLIGQGLQVGVNASSVLTAATYGIQSISAGAALISSGEAVLSNSNGISFGANGQSITADAVHFSVWTNLAGEEDIGGVSTINSAGDLRFQRVTFGRRCDFTQAALVIDLENTGTVTSPVAGTYGIWLGVYTMAQSTAQLVSSGSNSITWAASTNVTNSAFGGQSGIHIRTISVSLAVTPGEYYMGVALTTSGTGATMGLQAQENLVPIANPAGGNYAPYFNFGYYSSAFPGSLPALVQVSDVIQTAATPNQDAIPYVVLAGTY